MKIKKVFAFNHKSPFISRGLQAQRQDSVTGGAEINFRRAREVYLCEFERGTGGTRNLSQSRSNEQGEDQK